MKEIIAKLAAAIFILAVISGSIVAGEKPVLKDAVAGKWEIAANDRLESGFIVFYENNRYQMDEKHKDGTGVKTEGEYILKADTEPARIDICLKGCNDPGSEWTTRFGIIRVLSENELEIYTSPDSNYPAEFPVEKTSEYSMMLTRIE